MTFAIWALIIGVLLIVLVRSGTLLKRRPLNTAMLYLAAGFSLGSAGWAVLTLNPLAHAALPEGVAEVAVVLVMGPMLPFTHLAAGAVGLLVLLFLVIRPASVWPGLLGSPVSRDQRAMIAWSTVRSPTAYRITDSETWRRVSLGSRNSKRNLKGI